MSEEAKVATIITGGIIGAVASIVGFVGLLDWVDSQLGTELTVAIYVLLMIALIWFAVYLVEKNENK